jgi:uncharacterized cupin superfamily protein
MSDYSVAKREDAFDIMAQWPGYGEMLSYTGALGAEQVAITWRKMPAGTGGKGSYGHRHKTQEELYLVLAGELQAKVGDDVFTLEPGTALRVAPSALRSIHNDGPGEAEVVICSVRVDDPEADAVTEDGFWPEEA